MNWRAVIDWTVLSIVAWFLLVALIGLLASVVIQQEYDLQEIPFGQAGMLVPVVISIGLFLRLAAGYLLATSTWALLVKRLPQLEYSRRNYFGLLALYSVVFGVLAWRALPLNQPFSNYGAALFIACFILPRFLTNRLSPGVFGA
jgi:hypothetical protein